MPELRFELTRDVERFASQVEGFLAAWIERNLLATVLVNVRSASSAASKHTSSSMPS